MDRGRLCPVHIIRAWLPRRVSSPSSPVSPTGSSRASSRRAGTSTATRSWLSRSAGPRGSSPAASRRSVFPRARAWDAPACGRPGSRRREDPPALDALPPEDLGLPRPKRSEMHACGHDGHVASAWRWPPALPARPRPPVSASFQPAEEGAGGAEACAAGRARGGTPPSASLEPAPRRKDRGHRGALLAAVTSFHRGRGGGCHKGVSKRDRRSDRGRGQDHEAPDSRLPRSRRRRGRDGRIDHGGTAQHHPLTVADGNRAPSPGRPAGRCRRRWSASCAGPPRRPA